LGGAGGAGNGGAGGDSFGGDASNDCTNVNPDQPFEQSRFESGDINPQSDIRVSGDNNVVNPIVQQSGLNSGNFGNQQGNQPTFSDQGDVDFSGGSFESDPSLSGSS
jgi:hypothetical protein